MLEKYDHLTSRDYCRPGCGECLAACPYDVPVNDIMRYTMYAERYGREKDAMLRYARLNPNQRADHCLGCTAPCEARCPFELPIRHKLMHAHQLLRWT